MMTFEFLLDPNIGFVLLIGGVVLAILALFMPGTGLLEIGALFALVLAGYTLINLPLNTWAIVLFVIGIIFFVLALIWRGSRRGLITLLISLTLLVIGSIFAFRSPQGGSAVNPVLAVLVTGGSAGLLWFMARKSIDAAIQRPTHDYDRLVGMVGEARTDIRGQGAVYVGGEEWTATCSVYVPAGTPVRVLRRNGLVLEVEPIKKEE
jgi:membrane-bound serine protease (ClpP class)